MSEKTEIHAVEMVRQIRDRHAEFLTGKHDKELLEFFARAGETIQKQAKETRKTQPAQRRSV